MEGTGLITGLTDSTTPRLPKLSDVLCPLPKQSFESFALLPSNSKAVKAGKAFACGNANFVAIVGPSGWGKSHLLEAACRSVLCENKIEVEVHDATSWVMSSAGRGCADLLILDNVQDALDRGRIRLQLRLSLERRVRAGRPTLLSFTSQRPSRAIRAFLPHSKEWIVCPIGIPNNEEREELIAGMAVEEGLKLSNCLVWLLSHRMGGNGCSLLGALKRLKLHHTDWMDPSMTLRACGMLNMFFSDEPSWDLRDHIATCAEEFDWQEQYGSRRDLALFAMLRVAMLAEADVAQYASMEPAQAYLAAVRFESRVSTEAMNEVLRFIRFVITGLKCA